MLHSQYYIGNQRHPITKVNLKFNLELSQVIEKIKKSNVKIG